MKREVLQEAIMTNSGKIENLFGKVNKLESTLNEINEKLSKLTQQENSKVSYESKSSINYGGKKCYLRISEEDFQKVEREENGEVLVELFENGTNKLIDKLHLEMSYGHFLIESIYFSSDDFVKLSLDNGAKKIYRSPFIKNPNKKLKTEDFKILYDELGFDKWYEKVILPHKEVNDKYSNEKERIEHDNWEEDVSSKDKYARVASILSWFDIDKIARNIVRVNSSSEDRIETYKVDNTNVSSVKRGLYEDVKGCVEDFFNYGEADEDTTYKEFQKGRIHLLSIKCCDKEDGDYIKTRIFWTDEDVEEDVYDV